MPPRPSTFRRSSRQLRSIPFSATSQVVRKICSAFFFEDQRSRAPTLSHPLTSSCAPGPVSRPNDQREMSEGKISHRCYYLRFFFVWFCCCFCNSWLPTTVSHQSWPCVYVRCVALMTTESTTRSAQHTRPRSSRSYLIIRVRHFEIVVPLRSSSSPSMSGRLGWLCAMARRDTGGSTLHR